MACRNLILLFSLTFVIQPAYADDIEVLRAPTTQKPNVLFVLERSGSMPLNLAGDLEPTTEHSCQYESKSTLCCCISWFWQSG